MCGFFLTQSTTRKKFSSASGRPQPATGRTVLGLSRTVSGFVVQDGMHVHFNFAYSYTQPSPGIWIDPIST
jgi:hypothetical protein